MKLASEACLENLESFTTKYEQIAKLEHFICPKVCVCVWGGGGGTHPLVPPTFERAGARAPAALLLRP